METDKTTEIKQLGETLLEIGSLLMSSGASSHRIRMTVTRVSKAFGYDAELLVTNRAITLTLNDDENRHLYHSLKRTSPHGVNFKIVSGISRMSWRVADEKWSIKQINDELLRLVNLPHYPRLLVLSLVALAGASFCRIFGGSPLEMSITFLATFVGLFIRQQAIKLEFNPYLCVYFAAFISSFISILASRFPVLGNMEHSITASVLFLIPGVPLINSFTDILDGNIQNGIVRGVNSLVISLSIALGILTARLFLL